MTNSKELILTLKEVREARNLSFDKIIKMIEENDDVPVSKSTLSRLFAEGSENKTNFNYENVLRPVAKALLDIETIEADDDAYTRGFKSVINFKKELLFEYEKQIEELKAKIKEIEQKEKLKYHEKLEAETESFQANLAFLNHQVELKDHRIDHLLDANEKLLNQLLMCRRCKDGQLEAK